MSAAGSRTNLRGAMTALITPFRNGEVDWPRLEALVDRQIEGGTDWLVPLGTTGETPTLTENERDKILESVIARAAGRCPVMMGTGSNSTATTVEHTKRAATMGVDAALVVAPYYNRPTQEGLYRHFAAVASAVDLPIVLYNVPARTGVTISNDTIVRLREGFTNIVAIKDATGNLDAMTDLSARCDIAVLSGDDSLTWPFMALGAVGVVSVLANLYPGLMKSLVSAGYEGNMAAALQYHRKVYDLATGIGRYGPNPLPIKTAMAVAGLIAEEFRLPLCPLDGEAREGIARVLRRHEIMEMSIA
jgi:4-hydroxy-tetrahydrodipicolinate synthase